MTVLWGLFLTWWGQLMLDLPGPLVDHLGQLNAPAAAVPEDQRAWPLYRDTIQRFGVIGLDLSPTDWVLWPPVVRPAAESQQQLEH